MLAKNFLLTIALFAVLSAFAGRLTAQTDVIGLRDAIRLALDENPQFRSFAFRAQALEGERITANLQPAIRVSGQIENLIGTGDLNWFQGTEFTLAMSRVIEFGGKLEARSDVVSRRQGLLTAQQRVLELDLIGEVTRRFIELAASEQRRDLLLRSETILQSTFNAVDARVESGRAPSAERFRASAALQMARLAVQSAELDIAAARVRLSSLWNDLEPGFESATAQLLQFEETIPVEALLARLEKNPGVLIYADESRLRDAELREARSRRGGDVNVSVGIRHLAELNDSAFTVQASMPLFNKRRASGAIETATANLALVDSRRNEAVLRISASLIDLDFRRRQAAIEMQAIQSEVLPQLQSAMDETLSAFTSGRYSLLELSAAQTSLLQAEQNMIDAATRVHLLTAEIEQLSGTSITGSTLGENQ